METPEQKKTKQQQFAGLMFWLVFVAFLLGAFMHGPITGFIVLGIEALLLCLLFGIDTSKK